MMSNVRETVPTNTDAIRKVLEFNGYSVTELTFDVASPNTDYNLAYINFLQVGSHIILHTSDIDVDQQLKSTLLSPPRPSIPSVVAISPTGAVPCTA
jgi:hypothetical protein